MPTNEYTIPDELSEKDKKHKEKMRVINDLPNQFEEDPNEGRSDPFKGSTDAPMVVI